MDNYAKGRRCPVCKYKTEKKVLNFLELKLPGVFEHQRPVVELDDRRRKFDFGSENKKLIIEIDGRQHWGQHRLFNKTLSLEEIQSVDRDKEIWAKENGYTLLRFLQEPIWKGSYDWEGCMLYHILKKYDTPQVLHCGEGWSEF